MSKNLRTGVSLFILGWLCWPMASKAQKITNTQWFFGNSKEVFIIDKSARAAHQEELQAVPFGMNGSAVISNQETGDLIFYTDGQTIYDYTNQVLPGLGLGQLSGDPGLIQPVVASPVPDGSGKYYIFTNTGSDIEYTVVDPSLLGNSAQFQFPLGDITGSINQPTGLTGQGGLMTVVSSPDSLQFWLITQNASTFEFVVSQITDNGLASSNSYDVFNNLPKFEATAMAMFTDSLGAISFVVSPKRANRNTIILDFDNNTGALSFNQQFIGSGFDDTGSTVVYDAEWSNDGTKIYISRTGDGTNPGQVYQIDLSDTVNANPPATPIVSYDFFRSYGLKKGIDGKIYHLHQLTSGGPYNVGRIESPDSSATSGVYYDSLYFDADFNGTQFPQFAPPYQAPDYFKMSFTYLDSCYHSDTKFIALVDPLPNNFYWNFGDGQSGTGPAPIHTYDQPSLYSVTLTAELNDIRQSITLPVTIQQSDSVDLGNDTTICVGETLPLDAKTGVSWVWSTGETTQKIEVDTAGTFWVEVTFANGCTAFDDIVVTQYGVSLQLYNQWYFGNKAGLDFNTNPPSPLLDGQMITPEGCATVSDKNGHVLFYTNGRTVWNKQDSIMVNGTDIGGDSSATQSAMILPFVNDETMFYIFTTEEVYGDYTFNMKMSIVDMKGDTARGKVIAKNIPIIANSTERVTASGFTGTPWLMAHEYGNNNFRAYHVTIDGVSNAAHSSRGDHHEFQHEANAHGYMRFAPGLANIAVVVPDSPNYVNLLDFDLTSGAVSNSRLIDIEETDPIYGLEFSGDASKMYVTTSGTGSKLIQYSLDSINSQNPEADIKATKNVLPTTLPDYGALQSGPNGNIYIAIDGQQQLGTIVNPGADNASVQENSTDLGGRTSRLGLPNFTQQIVQSPPQPGITAEQACVGVETTFSAQGRDNSIETYLWNFGDSTAGDTNQNTTHTFTKAGTYIVSVTLSNRCDTDSIMRDTVQVYAIPALPTVPEDTSLCGGPIRLFATPTSLPGYSYYWSTGQTTYDATFLEPAIVQVAVISDHGCSSDTATVFIGQDETMIDLGPDQQICQKDTLVLSVNDPGPNFTWFRDGTVVGNQRTQRVNSTTAGTFKYSIEIVNDYTGCVYKDSVNITIQPGPVATQSNIQNANCGQADGSFTLDINSSGNFDYQVTGAVAQGPFNFDGPGTTPPITGLYSGSYTALITNTVTGCVTTTVVQLEDNAPFNMTAEPRNDCAHTSDIAIIFSDQIPSSVEINVLNASGINVYSNTQQLLKSTVEVNDLDSGTYYVEVRDTNPPNCIQTDTVKLAVSPDCFDRIFIPNAFSPNGDGVNDQWYAFPNEYVNDFQIWVFNRWGEAVFYSTDKNFKWDGTFQGSLIEQGTYAVRILFTSTLQPEKGTLEQNGVVTVLR